MPVSNPYNYLGGFNFQPIQRPNAPTANTAGAVANAIDGLSGAFTSYMDRQQKQALLDLQTQKTMGEIEAQNAETEARKATMATAQNSAKVLGGIPFSKTEQAQSYIPEGVANPALLPQNDLGSINGVRVEGPVQQAGAVSSYGRTLPTNIADRQSYINAHPSEFSTEQGQRAAKAATDVNTDPGVNKDFGAVTEWTKNNPKANSSDVFNYAMSVNPALADHAGFKAALAASQKSEEMSGTAANRAEVARHNQVEEAQGYEKIGIDRAAKAATAAKEKAPSENQNRAAYFGHRIERSTQEMKDLMAQGYNPASVNTSDLPNVMQTAKTQAWNRAVKDVITGLLRPETGAAIGVTEPGAEYIKYIPKFGDTPETIERKMLALQQAINGVKSWAGPAWNHVAEVEQFGGSNPAPQQADPNAMPQFRSPEDRAAWERDQAAKANNHLDEKVNSMFGAPAAAPKAQAPAPSNGPIIWKRDANGKSVRA